MNMVHMLEILLQKLTICGCLCMLQVCAADLSTQRAYYVWTKVQGSNEGLWCHSLQNQYLETTAAGGAPCGHTTVGF